MLVRRLSEAPVEPVHRLSLRILMDAGELGSRKMSATVVDVPAGVEQTLRSHEDAESLYIVLTGSGRLTVAGDTQNLGEGDLVLVPPATDHTVGNDGTEAFSCISVQSPPVSVEELYHRELDTVGGAYELDDD